MSMLKDVGGNAAKYKEDAEFAKTSWGKTELFPFFDDKINEKIGGGLAKEGTANLILTLGKSGIGKSVIAANIVVSALLQGKFVEYEVLEDSGGDTLVRLEKIAGKNKDILYSKKLILNAEKELNESYTQKDVMDRIRLCYEKGVDLVVIDHIQFMFEMTAGTNLANEWNRQRMFVRELNYLAKTYKKSLLLVSHVNKTSEKEGISLDLAAGSSAVPQIATKILYLSRNDEGHLQLHLLKSRYTANYWDPIPVKFDSSDFIIRYDGLRETKDLGL